MMRHAELTLSALMVFACCSCGHNDTRNDENYADTLSVSDHIADTTAIEPEPTVEDSVLMHEIETTEEAMAFMRESSNWEEYKRGIIPTIAEQEPQYAMKLVASTHPYFVIVDKSSMYVILYNRVGVEQERYKMCCSKKYGTKHAKRDNRTPEGFFKAGLTHDSTDWLYTDDDGKTSKIKGQFGPRFIRVTNPVSSQIGIHGTCAPWSLGTRSSHGCIRIHNDNIMKLVEYVTPGTPIIINPGRKDKEVNDEEGYDVPRLLLGKHREKPKEEMPKETPADSINKPDSIPAVLPDSIPVIPNAETEHEPDSISIPDILN